MDQISELYISLSKIVLNIRENDTLYDIFISTNVGHGYKLSCSDPNKFPNRIIIAQYQVIDILNNFLESKEIIGESFYDINGNLVEEMDIDEDYCDPMDLGNEDNYIEPVELPVCSVCLEDIHKDNGKQLSCGHRFHKDCLDKWLSMGHDKTNGCSCPNCRESIVSYHTFFGKKTLLSDLRYLQKLKSC